MADDATISGDWRGIFNYPNAAGPSTEFDATLCEANGAVVGTISEIDPVCGATLTATVDGNRDGTRVTFTKFYEADDENFDTVFYAGELSKDGLELNGRWDIPGVWSGTFILIRAMGVETSVQAAAVEPVT